MGKMSQTDRQSKSGRCRTQKKRSRNGTNNYLKPGALAQIRYSKASASKLCTHLGKKRVAVLDTKHTGHDGEDILQNKNINVSPIILSPMRSEFAPADGITEFSDQSKLYYTPTSLCDEYHESNSRLESLPNDLLVKIICHLNHDQLKAVFHVSQKVRKAVIIARQFHFNYTTPDRTRQEMLNTITRVPAHQWSCISNRGRKSSLIASPLTPKAPKHGPRPPSRLKFTDTRQIAAVLFQESSFPSKSLVPSVLPKLTCKSLASNRVLFYKEDLCQAVAQNKLL